MIGKKEFYKLSMVSAMTSACGAIASDSTLLQNAKANDPQSSVVRVRDNDLMRYVVVSNGRGYELSCSNPNGLLKLIEGVGYPSVLLGNLPAKPIDSAEVQALKIAEQLKLDCEVGSRVLYKSALGGKEDRLKL